MGWLNDMIKEAAAVKSEPKQEADAPASMDDFKAFIRETLKAEIREALRVDDAPQEKQEVKQEAEPKSEQAPAQDIAEQVQKAMASFLNKQPITERPLEESYNRLFEG